MLNGNTILSIDSKGRMSLPSEFRDNLPLNEKKEAKQVFFIVDRTVQGIKLTLENDSKRPLPAEIIEKYGNTLEIKPIGVFCTKDFAKQRVPELDLQTDDFTLELLKPRRFDCLEKQVDATGRVVIPSAYRPNSTFQAYTIVSPDNLACVVAEIVSLKIS